MIDTFTGWVEGISTTRTEKAKEVVKKKENCFMKSFPDLVCPDDYKVTMGHYLLVRIPKGSLTPAFLPGESHGQRSLAGYSSWGCKESNMTEVT